MDDNTALVLALQLVALFSIAGALVLYLLCKIRTGRGYDTTDGPCTGAGKPILVTSADNAIGLQIAIHLANRGFRVFAGLKDGAASGSADDSVPAKVIRAWQKHRESVQAPGILIALPLDVTREDLLHEAVDIIRAHLPAGEDGMWAVVNTSNLCYRGRLDQQDTSHWDAMLRTNVVGLLRTSRKFQVLLRTAGGRIITLGTTAQPTTQSGGGLVAYAASRWAVEGASAALREELGAHGVKVVVIRVGVGPEVMFAAPRIARKQDLEETSVEINGCMDFQPVVLAPSVLQVLDVALTARNPKHSYYLVEKPWCRPLQILKIV